MSDSPEPTWWNGADDREQFCSDDPLTCACPDCERWREAQEPPDPGVGTALAEYMADLEQQMAEARRLK